MAHVRRSGCQHRRADDGGRIHARGEPLLQIFGDARTFLGQAGRAEIQIRPDQQDAALVGGELGVGKGGMMAQYEQSRSNCKYEGL